MHPTPPRWRYPLFLLVLLVLAVVAVIGGVTLDGDKPGPDNPEGTVSLVFVASDRQSGSKGSKSDSVTTDFLVNLGAGSNRGVDQRSAIGHALPAGRITESLPGGWFEIRANRGESAQTLQSALANSGMVDAYVEKVVARVPSGWPGDAQDFNLEWALEQESDIDLDALDAWGVTTGSDEVIVAVIDSGVDPGHPDLAGRVLPGADFTGSDNGVTDDQSGHGTKIASLIAGTGTSRIAGIAPGVKILPAKVYIGRKGTGFTMAGYLKAIDWAVANGADVINISMGCAGGHGCYSEAERSALQRARDAGVVVVASAGNSGNDNDVMPNYPAGYDLDNIVAVAAADRDASLWQQSSFGATSVDIAAPGTGIIGAAPQGGVTQATSGTSWATAWVSGSVALFKAANPTSSYQDSIASLEATAEQHARLSGVTRTAKMVNTGALMASRVPSNGANTSTLHIAPAEGRRFTGMPELVWRLPYGSTAQAVDVHHSDAKVNWKTVDSADATRWSPDNSVFWKYGRYYWNVRVVDAGKTIEAGNRSFVVDANHPSVELMSLKIKGKKGTAAIRFRSNVPSVFISASCISTTTADKPVAEAISARATSNRRSSCSSKRVRVSSHSKKAGLGNLRLPLTFSRAQNVGDKVSLTVTIKGGGLKRKFRTVGHLQKRV